jgi:hypothetical protein
MLDAQKGGWGYGWQNALSGDQQQTQQQSGTRRAPTGDKEMDQLLMLLELLQTSGGPGGAPLAGLSGGAGGASNAGGGGGAMPTAANVVSGTGVPSGFPQNVNGVYTTGPLGSPTGRDIRVPSDLANYVRGLQFGLINPNDPVPNVIPGIGNRSYGDIFGRPVDYVYPESTPFLQGMQRQPLPASELAREADLNAQLARFGL